MLLARRSALTTARAQPGRAYGLGYGILASDSESNGARIAVLDSTISAMSTAMVRRRAACRAGAEVF